MGFRGVKVDFFGGDGQSMLQYYTDILESAHKHKLVVNYHGSTLPRGLHRTYPNMVTMEAVRGFEFVTFDQGTANLQPLNSTIFPFSRNAFDPMDFTPVAFSEVPNIDRITSNAFELATAVLFLSGVQHYAEIPEGMAEVPEYVKQLMREIPVSWDATRFVDGYPGDFVIIARKKGDVWYVAGINGQNEARTLEIDLGFIGKPSGIMTTDGSHRRDFVQYEVDISGGRLQVELKPYGGFVIRL